MILICDLCLTVPHKGRCPNAPEPPLIECPECGRMAEIVIRNRFTGKIFLCEYCSEEIDYMRISEDEYEKEL